MRAQLRGNQMLDRTTALNNLKNKLETKIRELMDRKNDRMVQLKLGGVGTPARYTALDLEVQALVQKLVELRAAAASAQSQRDTLAGAAAEPGTATATVKAQFDDAVQRATTTKAALEAC